MNEEQFKQIMAVLSEIRQALPTNGHHQFPPILEGAEAIAKYVGRHRNSVYRWIKTHKLPAHKTPNGKYAISQQAIGEWMRARYEVQRWDV